MVKWIWLLVFCPFIDLMAQAYDVGNIPDSLKLNAHAVKRVEDWTIIVKSLNKVIVRHKYAITVLDQQGDDYAGYSNSYSSLENLGSIDGNLFDARGMKLKSVKRKEITDMPLSDGFSLMLDDRIKKHNFYHKQYPYTVEYTDEQELKNSYALPFWMPVEDNEYSVQQSRFRVEIPNDQVLRYKQVNFSNQPDILKSQSIIYTWEINNWKASQYEPYQPPFKELVPLVYVGLENFSLGSYTGNMSTWQNFGKLQNLLNKGRNELPESVKQQVGKLLEGVSNTEDKIEKLYQFLQANTRYVSIQLGIGGWQPFDAKYVAANKFGDCKALTNFMVSLLKEAGIPSYYVLITAGKGKKGLSEDFPGPYFNHVITCVPNDKDSIWLECTSQTTSAGYLGSFTGDRNALLIAEDGGYVVHTPSYSADKNLQSRNINASIDTDGNMNAAINTYYSGVQHELPHSLIHDATNEERRKYLNKILSLHTYQIEKSEYKETKGKIPSIEELIILKAPNYATVSGKRLFIVPNLLNRSSTRLTENKDRKYPIRFSESYMDIDSISILLPIGYKVESIPRDVLLDGQFGYFSVNYRINDSNIQLIRKRRQDKKEYPASVYPLLVKYLDDIYKADHERIVFVKS